jgi:uncharacterized protein YbaR (Trm112 family)
LIGEITVVSAIEPGIMGYPSGGFMLKKELLDILVCPKCKGDLEYGKKKNELICHKCKLGYLVKDDIPIMLIEEVRKISD